MNALVCKEIASFACKYGYLHKSAIPQTFSGTKTFLSETTGAADNKGPSYG